MIAILLKSIDISRLKVTAFENNKHSIDKFIIKNSKEKNDRSQPGEKLEFSSLMHEIKVLTY